MKKSPKQKEPKGKDLGYWLQALGVVFGGIGGFLAGLAELLKVIYKLP